MKNFFGVFAALSTLAPLSIHASTMHVAAIEPISESGKINQPEILTGKLRVKTLEEMERLQLTSGHPANIPWQDSYWPLQKGMLAFRYADPKAPTSKKWADYHGIYKKSWQPLQKSGFDVLAPELVDMLSPAEKYDLLVGDYNFTFTKKNWERGEKIANLSEKDPEKVVADWQGICHGWSPASIAVPRPAKVVTLIAADGVTAIPFYPSDIRGLNSLLWATVGGYQIGHRCEAKEKEMPLDANGRVREKFTDGLIKKGKRCFDVNPGTFHYVMTHVIGLDKSNFIIDSAMDHEVWNYAIRSYRYSYFNPITMEKTTELRRAKVLSGQAIPYDIFREHRGKDTAYLVGVTVELELGDDDVVPTHDTYVPADKEKITTVTYSYDLELNARSEIIGGEWYQEKPELTRTERKKPAPHPDFLWMVPKSTKPFNGAPSGWDFKHPPQKWDGEGAFPREWTDFARYNSEYAKPIHMVLDILNARSKE